ncbi:hypothetical protein LTSESEN_2356 [Salmonella enterica subsp. enterica serovar Senftenberg str. A4-543]|uniref:Uncharacterized protein n=1 Tax=Salmonella enterica subsp. enterica serovar Senftenberg str. A4-543 TaxID=913082 RepID=G5QZJ6_SALSE|nr:hypothetical protein LTSESEN_2356 [Salmonella enterica subsp. enterica serovar Senftenberg str. A4-543]
MKKEKGPDDEQTPMKRSPSKGVNDVGTCVETLKLYPLT